MRFDGTKIAIIFYLVLFIFSSAVKAAFNIEPSVTSTNLDRNTSTIQLGFTCTCLDVPAPCDIQLGLQAVMYEGGHDHHSADRPVGLLEPAEGRYLPDTPFLTVYTAPEMSGMVSLNGTAIIDSCGVRSLTVEIDVAVNSLSALPVSAGYDLIGSFGEPGVTSMHASNHYVTDTMSSFVARVAEKFGEAFPDASPLKLNDASLKAGGLFDIYNNWLRPHGSHRFGNDIDIDDIAITHLKTLRAIVNSESNGNALFINEGNHYHIRIPR